MADSWTFSEWSIGDVEPTAFVEAFQRFARVATALGGAGEGMVLQDEQDPTHFVIIRRWDSAEVVERWAGAQAEHADEVRRLVPAGGRSAVMTKVADLGGSATQSS
ncbi:antibiotic biosynthesis monooxygenase [Terrabacter carboxydivorans]|uniref:ABM domain-containing protein n=1 Tax=Terrabacter carboxydivorans TaxID=619730 RepID=A0ABN3M2T4_9MICO